MIKYKVIPKKQPGKKKGPVKFYAKTVWDGEVGLLDLCKAIERISTVSEADIMAVLTALVNVVPDQLADSKIVRLGELGSFRSSVNSYGHAEEKEVNANSIRRSKVLFHPGKRISKVVKAADYNKVN